MSGLAVLFSDNHLLAVAKPAGVAMVADASEDASLHELARDLVRREKAKAGNVFLGVVHRLDRPVSGVALFARTSKAAARLSAAFRDRRVHKTYWALSEGAPRADSGVVEHWLAKDGAANRVRVARDGERDAKLAVTRWRVLARSGSGVNQRAWIELEPETGRAHQLRVALASLGSPILGDLKYGASAPLGDRSIALHARRLVVPHPITRAPLALECPPPDRTWWKLVEPG